MRTDLLRGKRGSQDKQKREETGDKKSPQRYTKKQKSLLIPHPKNHKKKKKSIGLFLKG